MEGLEKALKMTGFVKCEFGPDTDNCQECKRDHVQLYFGNPCHEYPNDGDYLCADCVIELHEQNEAAAELFDQ